MRVIFNITGFGPFGGVEVNPSSALVRGIEQYCEKRGLPSDCSLGICHVLETSGVDSLATLHQLKQHHHSINDTTTTTATVTMTKVEEKKDGNETMTETIKSTSSTSTSKDFITVWLHFGVHGGATAFHLESTAYNVADFRIPDNRGWTPSNEPIIGSAPSQLSTALPIPELVRQLAAKEWKVQESTDPGRFVCNWIYFNSLYHCQHGGRCTSTSISPCDGDYSLFVHVPPSDIYNEASQLAFAHDLIACITQQLQAKTKHESQS